MEVGVRIKTGTGVTYHRSMSLKEMKQCGIRPATPEEEIEYYRQKPLFVAHKIKRIVLAKKKD